LYFWDIHETPLGADCPDIVGAVGAVATALLGAQ
jgi:hypothetical protein